jgi:hypothetical protein
MFSSNGFHIRSFSLTTRKNFGSLHLPIIIGVRDIGESE